MKFIFIILFSIFSPLQLFCHKAEKQSLNLEPEPITDCWLNCEKVFTDTDLSGKDFYEKYLSELGNFLKVNERTLINETMIYYFPQSRDINSNIILFVKDLIAHAQVCENAGLIKDEFLINVQVLSLRGKIFSEILEWEVLQKNVKNFQLKQLYYSYNILTLVIVVTSLLTLIFFVMYLLVSKNRKNVSIFTRQMLQAQEKERERISNELHDTVCQDLRILQFMQEEIVDMVDGQLQSKIDDSINLCKKISSDVRNTCYALTPSDLNEGLLEAVISFSNLVSKEASFDFVLSIQDDIKRNHAIKSFSKEKNLHIYRIIQEIINNIEKHAEAESASILIRSFDENNFKIIISDDGKGFDMKKASKKTKHFGLINLSTRVKSINGNISFNSEEGAGTQVTVTIPY